MAPGAALSTSTGTLAACAILCIVANVGCTASDSDKSGGHAPRRVTVLRMIDGEGYSADIRPFVDRVAELSGGSLRIAAESAGVGAQYEQQVIEDVRRGKADLGRVVARVWDTLGVSSFRALQAPFLIDSYALQQRLLDSPLPAKMLEGIRPLGLVGIALFGAEHRQLAGFRRRLVTPTALRGQKIGIRPSRATALVLDSLRARGVVFTPPDVAGLDGLEIDLTRAFRNYLGPIRYVTGNLDLFPRSITIFVNGESWRRLTPDQRTLLRRAAAEATPDILATVQRMERDVVRRLCQGRTLQLVWITPAQRRALRASSRSAYRELERDPQTASFMGTIERLKREVKAPPYSAAAPASCQRTARNRAGSHG
jgi:TRAP-type C4-dicarboxylate transport system substrate-binding protein